MVLYSFDTSVMINGRRDLLPPGTFPTLWSNIEAMVEAGVVRCVDLVLEELAKRDGDEIHRWAKAQRGLFLPLEEDIQQAVRAVLSAHPRLIGIGSGRSGADPFVVGLAKAVGGTVVSEELESRNPNKPKIPDVCRAMGIRHVNLMGFVQDQGWVFR